MNERAPETSADTAPERTSVTPEQARDLLASVPRRPRRQLGPADHAFAVTIIVLSLASGLMALEGHPWWAVLPGIGALAAVYSWLARRWHRVNEPRLGASTIMSTVFTVWLLIPLWRGITRGETAPFPESLVLGGFASAAWLVYYVVLLIRR
ncbi:hypothetical protein [Citricoccus sp.]|uniref:hypothetical protein n=1 Tax=Citricoccus sp. TaxID=1978372 RepID=UPI0028BE1D33|nr:hypothetical protein [Citricoccus sp.]